MDVLKHFSVPWQGLKDGKHRLHFVVDDAFFKHFKNEEITNGDFEVILDIDKKPGVSELTFIINGHSKMPCDRCMEEISLPISGTYKLLLKYGDEESNEDVIFIDYNAPSFSVAELIYEYILLSVPMVKIYNCEGEDPRPCNMEVLDKLSNDELQANQGNSAWETLKGIDFDE